MELLGLICCMLPALAIGLGIQGAFFRLAAKMVGGVEIAWPMAIGTVMVAGLVQSVVTGVLFGADLGLCGSIAAFLVWTAVLGGMTELSWGQAVIVGLLMIVFGWILGAAIFFTVMVVGAGAVVGGLGIAAATGA